MSKSRYSEITPEILALSELCMKNGPIDTSLYEKYDVKRGLRDLKGRGVLTGLTEISEIVATAVNEKGETVPCHGKLYYRGYDIEDIVKEQLKRIFLL